MPSMEAAVTEEEGLLEKMLKPIALRAERVALAILSKSFQRCSSPSAFIIVKLSRKATIRLTAGV
jgi:hypothetical protein